MSLARAWDHLLIRSKQILHYPNLPKAQKPEVRTSLIKTPQCLGSHKYIITHLTARPKQIFHFQNTYPRISKKARKLEAFTSLIGQLSLAADISAHISGHKKPTKFSKATWNEEEEEVMVL